jgi:HEAT repeat protein
MSLLSSYPGDESNQALELALADEEALIRRTAVDSINASDPKKLTELLVAMLYDPVNAVRIAAARRLAEIPSPQLDENQNETFRATLFEFQQAMEYSADFAFGRVLPGQSLRQSQEAGIGRAELPSSHPY